MEEQFKGMTEADQFMFRLGLEPVRWDHFADAISQKGETQFQAVKQRASEEDMAGSRARPAPDSLIGATIVIRSETVVSAYRIVSGALQAETATTEMLSSVAIALPQGAVLDQIVVTQAMYSALDNCADIVSHNWHADQYRQHLGWRQVMTVWKDRNINATVTKFDEDGVDAENGPFLALAFKEAIRAIPDGAHNRSLPAEGQ
jgi:hypothetical protein